MTAHHDVLVIGGGSAGYAAARTARDEGADVAIVDHGPLGGLCILRGCMPSKAILSSSNAMASMRRASEFGLVPVEPKADLAAIIDRKDRLIKQFADDRIEQLRDPRLTLYEDRAVFQSPNEIAIGTQVVRADSFVIATGSVASHAAIPGIDDAGYLTSDDILDLRRQPDSLIVLGGGPVAVELAQFFTRIGTHVSLIQRSDHILSHGDEDLARPVEERFREEGMDVYTGTQLQSVTSSGKSKSTQFMQNGDEKAVSAELVLQALGRRPQIDGLGLEAAGVEVVKGRLAVDSEMRTSQRHIFAVGDVNGLYEVVHIAVEQGEIAGFNAVRTSAPPHQADDRLKTTVVFTVEVIGVIFESTVAHLDAVLEQIVELFVMGAVLQIDEHPPPGYHGEKEVAERILRLAVDDRLEVGVGRLEFEIVDEIDPVLNARVVPAHGEGAAL